MRNCSTVCGIVEPRRRHQYESRFVSYVLMLFLGIALAAMSGMVQAQIYNNNLKCKIALVSPVQVTFATPEAHHEEGFTIKMTTPSGQPIEGLKVRFGVAILMSIGVPPEQVPPLPPMDAYGHFPNLGGRSVLTDSRGIANSGLFVSGKLPGFYNIIADVPVEFEPSNSNKCGSFSRPEANFRVAQHFWLSVGGSPIPALSAKMKIVMTLLLLVFGLVASRQLVSRKNISNAQHGNG